MLRNFALLFVTACAAPPRASLRGEPGLLKAQDYPRVLKSWTRSSRIYRGVETVAFLDVTFHAPELRRAFGMAFPDIYGHGGFITKRELVELSEHVEEYHTFFIKLFTADLKWNDLAKPDSIWRITLSRPDGSVSVGATEIVSVKIDANLRAVYPYLDRFDRAYLVRFPQTDALKQLVIPEDSQGFVLKIASALGVAKLHWDLEVWAATPAPSPS